MLNLQQHPPPKRAKTRSAQDTSANDEAFHNSTKPSWGPDGTLIYTAQTVAPPMREGNFQSVGKSIVGEHNDVRFGRFSAAANVRFLALNFAMRLLTCSSSFLAR